MNCEIYYAIITYLKQWELPKHIDKWTSLTAQREAKKFDLGPDQTLYKEDRLVIPEHRKMERMKLIHNKRHLGGKNDYYLLKQHCWWPKMEEDIHDFVKKCEICQKAKQDQKDEITGSSRRSKELFKHIGIDIVGPLPVTLTGK